MVITNSERINLYHSIYDPIMMLRIKYARGEVIDLDRELLILESSVYEGIKKSFNLTEE
tara:strand:- start:26 stop:202 length:177 start_codon:yes stop_codon:yes gene_type:complete